MTVDVATHSGGCLCGAVRYVVRGELRGVIACHCSQCRRTSGHFAAMTSAPSDTITITGSDRLVWFKSSSTAERGFCSGCGSNLFWRLTDCDTLSITAGTFDAPTGLSMQEHIFVADKSDYYGIDDNLPQKQRW